MRAGASHQNAPAIAEPQLPRSSGLMLVRVSACAKAQNGHQQNLDVEEQ
jgi:hypothetical protein